MFLAGCRAGKKLLGAIDDCSSWRAVRGGNEEVGEAARVVSAHLSGVRSLQQVSCTWVISCWIQHENTNDRYRSTCMRLRLRFHAASGASSYQLSTVTVMGDLQLANPCHILISITPLVPITLCCGALRPQASGPDRFMDFVNMVMHSQLTSVLSLYEFWAFNIT